MVPLQSQTIRIALVLILALLAAPRSDAQTTNILYSENFNISKTLGWSGSGDGVAGFSSSIVTNLANNGFPSAPTNGYLAMVANSSGKATNAGWWAAQVLTNISTPAGLGQTNLGKISLTARVRAKGLPPSGAVAILRIMASGDNPASSANYKRITFEPTLLQGGDWQTIGGTLDDTSLQAKSGSRYNFTPSTNSYEITLELSGYNQSTAPGYVAYNSPTGPSNGGRKNPGFAPNAGIRLEVDDVVLAITDPLASPTAVGAVSPLGAPVGTTVSITGTSFGTSPVVKFNGTTAVATVNSNGTSITTTVPVGATTGKVTVTGTSGTATSPYEFFVTSPTNLLTDPTFAKSSSAAKEYWNWFEGARLISTNNTAPDANVNWNNSPGGANTPFMFIGGWEGAQYAGFMQNQIVFNPSNGTYFTLSFKAKFETNYSAEQTFVTFMNGNDTQTNAQTDIKTEAAANLGQWQTYTARFNASSNSLTTMGGRMSIKVQPLGRITNSTQASAFFDDFVLTQQDASVVGPQINVKVGGVARTNGATANLFAPLIGYSTSYPIVLQNDGAQALTISNVTLSGTSFTLGGTSPATLQPGESRSFTATATPASNTPLSGVLTITSNDKETADQSYVVNLATTPVAASDDFDSGTKESLGWVGFYANTTAFDSHASVAVAAGALKLDVDSFNGTADPEWYYGAKKVFASPGSIDMLRSSISSSLRASGKVSGAADNKVQVYLESLNSSGAATGRVSLGEWVDDTADGTNDRVAVLLPEGGGYTDTQSVLSSATSQGFNPNAPAYQVVVMMTDFNFGFDSGNIVELDSLNLNLVTAPFEVANGGFESDATDFGVGSAPSGWLQYPVEGVSKNRVLNGDAVYNASTGLGDTGVLFTAYAGTKAAKIYGQNYYNTNTTPPVWIGPSQTGTVYQEWPVAGTVGLTAGQAIHARGAAKVYGIDPLSGGSTFKYGFRYMNAANAQVGSDEITTITSSNDVPDQWIPLVANGTVPAGAAKVQLIAEFVQNASTDAGAVYLDDLSVGLGAVPATQTVGSQTFQLAWSDEFDGSSLNSGNWTPEIGTGVNGWGNNEEQTYTSSSTNLRVEGGSLIIQALKSGTSWTSARIKSQDKRSFKYGKIEFRAKLPTGVGPWPAAWMMGTNISTVNWPACGEIDVMEWRGNPTNDANTVGHALHSPARHGANSLEPANRSTVSNPSTQFHTYAVVWNSNNMVFSVDGVDKATLTPPTADAEVFRKEFFLLLNLAMGGNYVGTNIATSLTNATYEVDYVRVYQEPQSTVVPSDTTKPIITIVGSNPASVPWGGSYSDEGATAFDAGDNASVAVSSNNPVNTTVPGIYSVVYTASDSKTNTTNATRTVNVVMSGGGTNIGSDGLSDVSRYAFGGTGTNPLPRSLMPTSTTTNNGGTNQLVLTYFARTNANVTTVPVIATNLGITNWNTNGVTVSVLGTINTNSMLLQRRQATTPMTGGQKFLRLRSTLTTP